MSEQRSFTRVKSNGEAEGTYKSSTPAGAAKKAFTKMGKASATITIRETTRGSAKKEFKYRCERQALNPPRQVERNGTVIEYKFETRITAA